MATTYTELFQLPKHAITDPFDITLINDSMDIIENALGKRSRVFNLLDNSDFLHPVNQRGATANTKSGEYLHDRWRSEASNNAAGVVQITDAGVTLAPTSSNYCGITQMLEHYADLEGKTVTLAVCVGGAWDAVSFTLGATPSGGKVMSNGLRIYSASGYHVMIRNMAGNSSITIQRVALYEGAYTADALPEYQPKGYAAEMAECQRYYYQTWNGAKPSSGSLIPGVQIRLAIAASRLINVEYPVNMRITPTVTLYTGDFIATAVRNWNNSNDTITGVTAVYNSNKGFVPGIEASVFTLGQPYSFHYAASADL